MVCKGFSGGVLPDSSLEESDVEPTDLLSRSEITAAAPSWDWLTEGDGDTCVAAF